MTGRELQLFLDRDAISWGEAWRERVDLTPEGATFFIPVLTPRYFGQPECRRELLDFLRRTAESELQKFMLPILYVNVPELVPGSTDELMAAVAKTQYVDWRVVRFSPPKSSEHRRAVNLLVARLLEIETNLSTASAGNEAGVGIMHDRSKDGKSDTLKPLPQGKPRAAVADLSETTGHSKRSRRGIFVSYRRDDDPGFAGRLYDRLQQRFGANQVFMDVDSIEYGVDFVEELDRALSQCSVLLAVIGPRWAAVVDEDGEPRLRDPDDFVRLEIEHALNRRDVRVIPILVDNTLMPKPVQLPESLLPLRRRNACSVSHMRFGSDSIELIATIDKIVSDAGGGSP